MIRATGPAGEPLDAAVVVDGWSFPIEEGRRVIRGVPAGKHTLVFLVPGRPAIVLSIVVPEGETVPVRLQFE